MPSQVKVRWAQLRVGVMAIVSMAILAVLTFLLTQDKPFWERYANIYTYMDDSAAMSSGAPARLNGILIDRYADGEFSDEVMARLDRELGVINKLGFANYFLIVWDYVRFARSRGIEATARGSGVGALVSYATHLSHVCPLEYDLLFERFLDENRKEAPDIDIDFCQQRRGEVIQYVKEKYGMENVAQIGTFGTLAARAAIRDCGRALGLPISRVDSIVALVPEELKIKLKDAIQKSDDLRKMYESDPEVRKLLELAKGIEGLARNVGTHAAAVVIADLPLPPLAAQFGRTRSGRHRQQLGIFRIERNGLDGLNGIGGPVPRATHDVVDGLVLEIALPEIRETDLRKPCIGDYQRFAAAQPEAADIEYAGASSQSEIVEHRRVRVLQALHLAADEPRSRLHPPVDHELAEAEKLIEVLVHTRFIDKAAYRFPRIDQALILELGQCPPNRGAGGSILAGQFGFGRQPGVCRQLLRQNLVPDLVGDTQVHGAGVSHMRRFGV